MFSDVLWKLLLHCKPIPCNEKRVLPVKSSHREIPVMKTGVPAMKTGGPGNENRFFPVWIKKQSTLSRFSTLHSKPVQGQYRARTGFTLWTFPHREKPVFITGTPCFQLFIVKGWCRISLNSWIIVMHCNDCIEIIILFESLLQSNLTLRNC